MLVEAYITYGHFLTTFDIYFLLLYLLYTFDYLFFIHQSSAALMHNEAYYDQYLKMYSEHQDRYYQHENGYYQHQNGYKVGL